MDEQKMEDETRFKAQSILANEILALCTKEDMERGTLPIKVIRRAIPELVGKVFSKTWNK